MTLTFSLRCAALVKGKGSPYSITERGVPEVLDRLNLTARHADTADPADPEVLDRVNGHVQPHATRRRRRRHAGSGRADGLAVDATGSDQAAGRLVDDDRHGGRRQQREPQRTCRHHLGRVVRREPGVGHQVRDHVTRRRRLRLDAAVRARSSTTRIGAGPVLMDRCFGPRRLRTFPALEADILLSVFVVPVSKAPVSRDTSGVCCTARRGRFRAAQYFRWIGWIGGIDRAGNAGSVGSVRSAGSVLLDRLDRRDPPSQ